MARRKKIIFTIGHSTRPIREFTEILTAHEIELLVDIRHYPGSKKFPQYGKGRLASSLKRRKISYLHLEDLGGRRRPDKNSEKNAGWRNSAFRGYADYMSTPEFKSALKELMALARKQKVVIMCAEAVPWRCHRSLVGDALLVQGFEVLDLFSKTNTRPHKLTNFAKVYRKKLSYPAPEQ